MKPPIFNGPVETGLRALALLYETYPSGLDLQRLVTLDYLLIHSAEVPGGPPSIHPPSPLQAGEVAVRRRLVEDGLVLYRERGLLHQHASSGGFEYVADDEAAAFLDSFTEGYVPQLRATARWVVEEFAHRDPSEVTMIISASIGRWRAEFAFLGGDAADDE